MGTLHYPNNKTEEGPWLVGDKEFESLSELSIKVEELLVDSRKLQIESEAYQKHPELDAKDLAATIQKELDEGNNKFKSEYLFQTKDGKVLKDSALSGLLKDESLDLLAPTLFKMEAGFRYDNNFDLRIERRFGELSYSVNCYDTKIQRDIKHEIDKWIKSIRPKKYIKIWTNSFFVTEFLSSFLPFAVAIIVLYFISPIITYEDYLKEQSRIMIENGIDSTNRDRAIELILKLNSDYSEQEFTPPKKERNPRLLKVAVILFIIWIVAANSPKTTIGLGKLRQRLVYYRLWIKLVTYTLPLLLFVTPFLDKITNWLWSF